MTTDWVRGRRGGVRRVFLADEAIGGGYGTGRRLFVDGGVLNPALNAEVIGSEASKVWDEIPLARPHRGRDRA